MSEEQQGKSHRLSPKARPRKPRAHLERKPLNGACNAGASTVPLSHKCQPRLFDV